MDKKKTNENSYMRGKVISNIINMFTEKNMKEEQHSFRVSQLCRYMGESLGLNESKINELKVAGLLHDIGKIEIEDDILNKPDKLNDSEYEEIKRHPEIGYRIINAINNMSEIAEYVLSHHEMWNGTGYPKGLEGENIPIESRIIAIADAYDAMTRDRCYRKALPKEFAIKELKKNAGIQFDSNLVEIFTEKVLVSKLGILEAKMKTSNVY